MASDQAKVISILKAAKIIGKDGNQVKLEDIQTDEIGLYFSAHWCPPCRGFTPELAGIYDNLKKKNDKKIEIIFVSSDRDQKSFDEYYGEMPWLKLSFEDRDSKQSLSELFNVRGIPTLIILNKDGTVKTADGRSMIKGSEYK